MAPIYQKIRERGLLWALKRALAWLGRILLAPLRLIQKVQAISAARHASRQPREALHVVFVCDQLHVRAIKIAYALRQVGWRVTLLHRASLTSDVSEYFNDTRQFRTRWGALLFGSQYHPIVYHVFSMWNFNVASTLMRYRPGRVVFDNYDVLTGTVKENVLQRYPGQAQLEQYCYAHADGLCCRDLRVQFLKRRLGYNLPPTILFPEYCWPQPKFKMSPKCTDGIHVVYVGSVEPDPKSPVGYLYELAALLSRRHIHLDIYPSFNNLVPQMRTTMKQFVGEDVLDRYVHIHNTISPLDVREEISKYHYGLLISSKSIDFGSDNETYFQHQSDYFLASKIFDYLDAGLFTLAQNARLARFLLERCNSGKVVTSLEDIALQCISEPPRNPKIPNSLLLESNVSRLTTFYLKISSSKIR